jgi:hypothetical protein
MAGFMEMQQVLHGKVRGNPVDISLLKDQGYELITRAAMEEQMRSIGMEPAMLG